MIELNTEEIQKLHYQVMVEMWNKVMESMSRRKKYQEAFNEKERNTLSRYYKIFYAWYLKTGAPESCVMSPDTLALLERAINFFGGIDI